MRLGLGQVALIVVAAIGCSSGDRSAGEIRGGPRSRDVVEAAARATLAATEGVGARVDSQILFGDLHVHTTFSIDALVYALPLFEGEGAHPPADACDYARHCAGLDFFSLNDHAEGLFPARWRESIESIRQCNELAGDPADPDLVAYVGWEWTQAGPTPETHYGHKNVIYPGLADDELPRRPITSLPDGTTDRARAVGLIDAVSSLGALGGYADLLWQVARIAELPDCPTGVDTRELPTECRENAPTPELLFEKLAQWQLDTLVIPHGLAWGIHAPPGARLDNQLDAASHDPAAQRLIEVFSGHGNSEEYRELPGWRVPSSESEICPEPTDQYLACCWRAGELVRERCGEIPESECEARVATAQQLAMAAGTDPHRVLPEASVSDWLDCDQCRDCFKPAMTPRPGETAQYSLALSRRREADERPLRFRWGFIASSDNHSARAGSGYKQVERHAMTDIKGIEQGTYDWLRPWIIGRQQEPGRAQPVPSEERGFRGLFDVERGSSFLYPAGLVAVHTAARDRDSIWNALVRREVYGTSGPRILLWFDLLNGDRRAAMGSEVELDEAPRFEVRAVGALAQLPGCPEDSVTALSSVRLESLCRGECYNPSDRRQLIAAIEVVRIRPQRHPDEPPGELIEDPWRRFECPPDPAGCVVHFSDDEYASAGRDAVYYVRALQQETPAINGATLRTTFDDAGSSVAVDPCYADARTSREDDCLAPVSERAWSSPIFVDWPRS